MQVLIAEDDAISRRILQTSLAKWGYQVVAACDGSEAWRHLTSPNAPQLAILDWMMPGMDGIDICKRIRSETGPYTYVILLTARGQKEDLIEGMEAGADDYVTKPFHSGELKVRLRAAQRILDLESQLLTTQEALRDESMHDSLTGLWNRTAILEILQREIERGQRDGASVGIIIADIDHFKKVNDTFGHKAGDAVLCKATEIMKNKLRPYDAIGRYGGEEFLIVMPGCQLQDAANKAERLRYELSGSQIQTDQGIIGLTVCMGVTASAPDNTVSTDILIQAADAAMYDAKRAGRNRVSSAGKLAQV